VSVVIVGVIRRKPVLTHASIVCEGMLALVNSVNSVCSNVFECAKIARWHSCNVNNFKTVFNNLMLVHDE